MTRVITYIDGFNLYYGLRSKGWRYFYWLDVQKMSRHMLKSHQTLVRTKYFTSIIASYAQKQAAYGYTSIGRNVVSKSVFPDQVIKPDGFVLNRPDKWLSPPR
jgi:hypothetical protein